MIPAWLRKLEVADVALVPVRPTVVDLSRHWRALELAAEAEVPALVVLSQVLFDTV